MVAATPDLAARCAALSRASAARWAAICFLVSSISYAQRMLTSGAHRAHNVRFEWRGTSAACIWSLHVSMRIPSAHTHQQGVDVSRTRLMRSSVGFRVGATVGAGDGGGGACGSASAAAGCVCCGRRPRVKVNVAYTSNANSTFINTRRYLAGSLRREGLQGITRLSF